MSDLNGPLQFLEVGGVEVGNAARTLAYMKNGLLGSAQGFWEFGTSDPCSVLYRLNGGTCATPEVFTSPAADPAPWYDADEAGSSSFLGFVLLGMDGYDSTIQRGITARLAGLQGGTLAAQRRAPRVWTFQGAMISADGAGAEYGLRWLTQVLQSSACDGCATDSLVVRLFCPDAGCADDSAGEWTSYEVALTEGPKETQKYSDGMFQGSLGGCRDMVVVEFTLTAANPFLYRRPVEELLVDVDLTGDCEASGDTSAGTPMAVTGDPITDAVRALNVQGDGLPATDSSYGIWAGTTNLVQYGGAETSGTKGWVKAPLDVGFTRVTTEAKFGSYSFRVSTPGHVAGEGIGMESQSGIAAPAGAALSFSMWIKGAVGGELLKLTPNITNTDLSVTTGATSNISLTNTWRRYEVQLAVAGGKTGNRARLDLESQSTLAYVCYVDGGQIEAAYTATPYVETAGAFASRAAALVEMDATSCLNPENGWAAFYVRMGWDSTLPAAASAPDPVLMYWSSLFRVFWDTDHWAFQVGATTVDAPPTLFSNGDLTTVIVAWDTTDALAKISVNGASFTTGAYAGTAITDAVASIGSAAGSDQADADVLWMGASSAVANPGGPTHALTNTQAVEIVGLAPTDPAPEAFSFDLGDPGQTLTWAAETTATVINGSSDDQGICEFLFGEPTDYSCLAVETPSRGALGAIYTCTSVAGFTGGLFLEAYTVCPGSGGTVGDPALQMLLTGIPAGSTVQVDGSRHTVTVTDGSGNATDGQYLLALPAGRGLEWIEAVAGCDPIMCFCVRAAANCAAGEATIVISTQNREG